MTRVRMTCADGIGRITLARPEKKNALDRQAATELEAALRACAERGDVRVVALDAEGEDFCAGADLDALATMVDAPRAAHEDDARALGRVFETMRALPIPVVAAVRGRALAGGAGLATACDIVLAHEDARFGYPEVRVGFVPAMVMTLLRRSVGERRAFELVATGRLIGAQEAWSVGLVSRVFPAAEFEREVHAVVAGLAAAPPTALRLTKRLFYALHGQDFAAGIALGVQTNADARATEDFRAGVARFTRRSDRAS